MKESIYKEKGKNKPHHDYIQFPIVWLRGFMKDRNAVITRILQDGIDCRTDVQRFSETTTMVKREMLIEFRDTEKSELEVMQFLYFAAIKSILGQAKIKKTRKEFILARACGYVSDKQLDVQNDPVFIKYALSRKRSNRILTLLQYDGWNVKVYSAKNMRGILISIGNRSTKDDLIEYDEKSKLKFKNKVLKIETEEAKNRVRQKMSMELRQRESAANWVH